MKKILLSLMAVVMCGMVSTAQTVSGNVGGHDYVDLGLPSGTLWATCNVGATKPTEYGDLFAWGETATKDTFSYKICKKYKFFKIKDEKLEFTKYNTDSDYGAVDNMNVLETQDDAATVNWGGSWRMPTEKEMKELRDGCDWEWTMNYKGSGVAGRVGKSKYNGNTVFLPAAGYGDNYGRRREGRSGGYWSSSLNHIFPDNSYDLYINSGDVCIYSNGRYYGLSVRAVCSKK